LGVDLRIDILDFLINRH